MYHVMTFRLFITECQPINDSLFHRQASLEQTNPDMNSTRDLI